MPRSIILLIFVLRPLFFLFISSDIHSVSQSPPANFANSLFLITDFCSKFFNFVCGFSHLKPRKIDRYTSLCSNFLVQFVGVFRCLLMDADMS